MTVTEERVIAREDLGPEDLGITIGYTRSGQNNSTVTVNWCVSERLAQFLVQENARDVCVLILVTTENMAKAQQHQVVRLGQGQTYIGLRAKGINTIHATVIWRRPGEKRPDQAIKDLSYAYDEGYLDALELKKQINQLESTLKRARSKEKRVTLQQEIDLLKHRREAIYNGPRKVYLTRSGRFERSGFETSYDVDVAEEMFAPPPPRVLRWLADFASPRKRIDQCHTRRYAIYGLLKLIGIGLLVPFIAALWVLVKIVLLTLVAIVAIGGMRRINFKPVLVWGFGELEDDLSEIWEDTLPSRWYWKKKAGIEEASSDSHFERRTGILPIVNPATIVVAGVIIWLLSLFEFTSQRLLWIVGGALLGLLIGAILVKIVLSVKSSERNSQSNVSHNAKALEHELEGVVCVTPQTGITDRAMAPKRPSVHLKFLEVKSKVCRPYSE